MLLNFNDEVLDTNKEERDATRTNSKGKTVVVDDDLSKPLKTLDGASRGWFHWLPPGSIGNWSEPHRRFVTRFGIFMTCFKDPMEIAKIVRRAKESLATFMERWIIETSYILVVPEVMLISSFMGAHKSPEQPSDSEIVSQKLLTKCLKSG
ncbi:hypothetical protein Tco_1563958 [Tanacetum coccineum]